MIDAIVLSEVSISKDYITYYRCKELIQLDILNATYAGFRSTYIPIRKMEGAHQYLDLVYDNLIKAGYRIIINEEDWEVHW